MSSESVDVVLGVYDKGQGLTSVAQSFVAANFNQAQLQTFLNGKWGSGTVRIIYASTLSAETKYKRIAFVGLGEKQTESNAVKIEEQFESVPFELTPPETARSAASAAVAALKKDDKDTKRVFIDTFDGFDKPAAEGAVLGGYEFAWDKEHPLTANLNSIVIEQLLVGEAKESPSFRQGVIAATAQTLAAALEETPANKLTPTIFSNTLKQIFEELKNENVKVNIYDRNWAQSLGMGSFLSVSQGSEEEPRFLEIVYTGNSKSQATDLVLVGKGITFDTGGISLKPAEKMKEMKGDMGGAATVVSSLYAIVQLGVPLNITCVTPLCENMPSGRATKPGDVFTAMNKKTIEVDNTDAEGRLILADALCYASTKSPKVIIDAATLTGAIGIALGGAASGCFTNSNALWKVLQTAGQKTNDYFWRMPLFKNYYLKQMKSNVSHYNNIGGREGGSCSAASFLSEFVDFSKVAHWAHLDIACTALPGFGRSAMTGRPTRALIEAISSLQSQQL